MNRIKRIIRIILLILFTLSVISAFVGAIGYFIKLTEPFILVISISISVLFITGTIYMLFFSKTDNN